MFSVPGGEYINFNLNIGIQRVFSALILVIKLKLGEFTMQGFITVSTELIACRLTLSPIF